MKAAIYLMKSAGLMKIGYSKNPFQRWKSLKTGCPDPIALIFTLYCNDAPAVEKSLHKTFSDRRGKGEWFRVSVDEVLAAIIKMDLHQQWKDEQAPKVEPPEVITEEEQEATDEAWKGFFSEMSKELEDSDSLRKEKEARLLREAAEDLEKRQEAESKKETKLSKLYQEEKTLRRKLNDPTLTPEMIIDITKRVVELQELAKRIHTQTQ